MNVRIKRIYEPPAPEDGVRVLVDRLWPRGLEWKAAALDAWLPSVAPSTELRRWYGHAPDRWEEFSQRYQAELAAAPEAIRSLLDLAVGGKITLLFAARDIRRNNAVVLASYLEGQSQP